MEEKKNEQHKFASKGTAAKKGASLGGKKEYVTGGKNRASRPEQGPDVPPEERTMGIP